MDPYEKHQCLRALRGITSNHISQMFANPVVGVPNYHDVVSRPMDLSIVHSNLVNDRYATVREWKDDVELIWENAYAFNGRDAVISLLARQLQIVFQEETELVTGNARADWAAKLESLRFEVERLAKAGPKPAGAARNVARPVAGRPVVDARPKQREVVMEPVTDAEIVKITEHMNTLEDDGKIQKVIALIREREPHVLTMEEEVEVEVRKLKPATLIALRTLVQSFR